MERGVLQLPAQIFTVHLVWLAALETLTPVEKTLCPVLNTEVCFFRI